MKKLSLIERTAKEGSFIYFNKGESYYQADSFISNVSEYITTKNAQVLSVLIDSYHQKDSEDTVSYNDIYAQNESFGSRNNFSKILRNLRSSGFLVPIEFECLNGHKIRSVKCDVLNLNLENQQPLESTNFRSNAKDLAKHRNFQLQELKSHNIKPPASHDITSVVRPKNDFYVERFVSQRIRPRGIQKLKMEESKTFDEDKFKLRLKSGDQFLNLICHSRSYSGLMDSKDLQVLLAIYTLIYNYHSNELDTYLATDTLPRNLTPIASKHIASLIGLSKSTNSNDYIHDSIQSIEDTEYNLYPTDEVELDVLNSDAVLKGYTRQKFKNFEKCIPISNSPASFREQDGGIILPKATLYLIALPDQIFKDLMEEKTLFAFPPEVLSIAPLLFSLYLRFRALCKPKISQSTKNLWRGLGQIQKYPVFMRSIHDAFASIVSGKKSQSDHLYASIDKIDNTITFNLLGFKGTISLPDDYYTVECDYEEMMSCCNVERRSPASKKVDAPIIFNELHILKKKVNTSLQYQITKVIKSVSNTRYYKYHIAYKLRNGDEINIHKYLTKDEINSCIEDIVERTGIKSESENLLIKIQVDIEKIDGLMLSNSYHLTVKDFNVLLDRTDLSMYKYDLDISSLLNSIQRRVAMHDKLIKFLSNPESEQIPLSFLKFVDEICDAQI